ncbi:MAG: hypothetical protein KJ757_01560 [Planctomycetes bacterium]|nr:hypothetical protein [Planctomycetota bacterium]MBU1517913.1 hypothetical protein [Planctomycetota bacterium]MBU2596237.1 hypothetical protein [Planctomycetota bacterium]
MNHWIWPASNVEQIERELEGADKATRTVRAKRLQFIQEEFGPPANMVLIGGIPAMFALHEMTHSFVVGDFMTTILLAQVFIEHTLGGSFIMAGDDDTATGGFAKLIKECVSDASITSVLAEKLDELRRMRNPYTHPNPGVTPRSHMGRIMEQEIYNPEELAEKDARTALRTVVDFLRNGCPNWNPENPQWKTH